MSKRRPRSHPAPVGDVLARVLKASGLDATLMQVELVRRWKTIVGAQMAKNTWPEILREGQLVVATEHPAWKHELHFRQTEILDRVNGLFGRDVAKTIQILVRPRPGSDLAPMQVRPAAQAFGSDVADQVHDDVLKDAVRRAAAANAEARLRGRFG